MPNRYIRDGINSSRAVAALNPPEEVFFRRMINEVDDFGRFEVDPKLIRSQAYPVHDGISENDILAWLAACVKQNLIITYMVDGKTYLVITKSEAPRAKNSKFPNPPAELIQRYRLHTSANACMHMQSSAPTPNTIPTPTPNANANPVLPPAVSVLKNLENALNTMYSRKPNSPWTYAEQTQLAEISLRPDVLRELQVISALRHRTPTAERRYFPHSIGSLLSKWTDSLDKASSLKPKPAEFTPPPPLKGARLPEAKIKELVEKMASDFREQLKKTSQTSGHETK